MGEKWGALVKGEKKGKNGFLKDEKGPSKAPQKRGSLQEGFEGSQRVERLNFWGKIGEIFGGGGTLCKKGAFQGGGAKFSKALGGDF